MTDQPTDHRAEAKRWLETAQHSAPDVGTKYALLGIGHMLGAIHDALLALGEDRPVTKYPFAPRQDQP